jgi:hypothetical protein
MYALRALFVPHLKNQTVYIPFPDGMLCSKTNHSHVSNADGYEVPVTGSKSG